jgi:hypothetical protein
VSHTVHEGEELIVGTYCGPAIDSSRSRIRWQFTVRDRSDVAVLTVEELEELLVAMIRQHGDLPAIARRLRAPVSL